MPPVSRCLRSKNHRLPARQRWHRFCLPARLAQACHLALETDAIDFDIMHTTGHPEADQYCNVARSREILGLEYKGLPPTEG